ncbi:Putative membrane protein OS=Streptomyces griseomycini OX=66895 GN=FHS37_004672 PE=3 SV=1 [Streptomyces griseomycini]
MSKTTVKDVAMEPESPRSHSPERAPARRTEGSGRALALLLVITGAAGVLAAWVITLNKFKLLEAKVKGETFVPGLSLNPVVSCAA